MARSCTSDESVGAGVFSRQPATRTSALTSVSARRDCGERLYMSISGDVTGRAKARDRAFDT
jgi:hypothetical protein